MDSLSVSASNSSSCPNHCKGLVEIKCRGRERQSRLLLPLSMSVCVHMCSINSQWGQKQDLYEKKHWNPKPRNPSKTCLLFVVGHTVKESCATLQPPFSGEGVLIREFLSTELLPARWVGPPSLGRGFCQRSVFCSYFRGKALHLLLGREGNFPLKCFLSLSLSHPV